jgi:predicted RNase H-like HicB family nuclease
MICMLSKTDNGYLASIEEIPNCSVTARTPAEAASLIRLALCAYFREHPEAIPLAFKCCSTWFSYTSQHLV